MKTIELGRAEARNNSMELMCFSVKSSEKDLTRTLPRVSKHVLEREVTCKSRLEPICAKFETVKGTSAYKTLLEIVESPM